MAGRPLAMRLAALAPRPDAIVLAGFGSYGTGAVKEIMESAGRGQTLTLTDLG